MIVILTTRHPIFEVVGGSQEYIKTLAKSLSLINGIEKIFLVSSAIYNNDKNVSSKIRFVRIGKKSYVSIKDGFPKTFLFYLDFFFNGFLNLRNIVKKHRNVIIHSNESGLMLFILLPIKLIYGIPLVVTQHGEGYHGFYKLQKLRKSFYVIFTPLLFVLEKIFLLFSDRIIIVDDNLRKFYKDFYFKTEVVYNPIDYSRFKPSEELRNLRKAFGINNNDIVFLFLGRLSEEKGVKEIVECFSNLFNLIENIKLFFVGDGPLKSFVKDFEKKYPDRVRYFGITNSPEIFYNISDVLVFYSKFEERSRVIPEALACGTTIIATPTKEIIKLKISNPQVPLFLTGYNSENMEKFILNNFSFIKRICKIRKQIKLKEQDSIYVAKHIYSIYKNLVMKNNRGNVRE